jgi:hypothetical protein
MTRIFHLCGNKTAGLLSAVGVVLSFERARNADLPDPSDPDINEALFHLVTMPGSLLL